MAKQPVLIKSFFFLDTDAFQHLSQWEQSLIDFFAAHGLEMERISILGAGGGELFYTIRSLDILDKMAHRNAPLYTIRSLDILDKMARRNAPPKQKGLQVRLKELKKELKKESKKEVKKK